MHVLWIVRVSRVFGVGRVRVVMSSTTISRPKVVSIGQTRLLYLFGWVRIYLARFEVCVRAFVVVLVVLESS